MSRQGESGAARELRDETRRMILLHAFALWAAVLALGFLGAAFLRSLVFGAGEQGLLALCFSWASLGLALAAAIAGWLWCLRERGVERLVRVNLLAGYPDRRKEFEAWLSSELIGSRADLARALIERRLDSGLARRRWAPLARSHFLAMFLVLAGSLVLAVLHLLLGVSPLRSIDRYLGGFFAIEAEEPPRILELSPAERWIGEGGLESFEVAFDRRLARPAKVLVRSRENVESFDLKPVSERRYRAGLPSFQDRISLRIAVGDWTSRELEYRLYPERPVEVAEVRLFDGRGKEIGRFPGGRSPLKVPEGGMAAIDLKVSPCPLLAFGLGGSGASGELSLGKAGEGRFRAEARLLKDETFRPFWQLPGASARLGEEVAFQVEVAPVPDVLLLSPVEGARVEAGEFEVASRSMFQGTIARAYVLASDYLGLQWAWEIPAERRGEGWRAGFDVPLDLLFSRAGQVIGVCAAMQPEGGPAKVGYSQVVNVILPELTARDLARAKEMAKGSSAKDLAKGLGASRLREVWLGRAKPGESSAASEGGEEGSDKDGDRAEGSDPGDSGEGREVASARPGPEDRKASGKAERKEGKCPICGGG